MGSSSSTGWNSPLYMYVRTTSIRSIRNKRHTNFLRGPCDACAADDKYFQAFCLRFSSPAFIITRNAHGAEEGEGLGTRLRSLASYRIFPYAQFRAVRAPKRGEGKENTSGVTRYIFVGTAGMLAAPIKFKRSHDPSLVPSRIALTRGKI